MMKLKHFSCSIDDFNMWLSILVLLLGGVATAEHNSAWNTKNEYHYNLESRSLGGLPEVSDQFSGILLRGVLKIQPRNEETLFAKLSKVEFSPFHSQLPYGWESEIPENDLEYKPLIMSGKPFEVKLGGGIIKELIFDRDVPTWEINLHKSALSQLQIDTQGENIIPFESNQPLFDEKSGNAMFKTMEDSVGGTCEVMYDINPLPKPLAEQRLYHLPGKQFKTEGELFDIMKTKDYEKCQQRVAVNFGLPGYLDYEPASSKVGNFLSKSSISEVTLSGNLKAFTVHSSVTVEKIILSPNRHDSKSGIVASKVNLTLSLVHPLSKPWPAPSNSESVGNLAYTYEQPFSPEGEDRNLGEPSQSWKQAGFQDDSESKEKLHKYHFDESGEFSASEKLESDLEESQDEKKYYWQPKPTLNEPPQYPILPLFIANKGKALASFDSKEAVNKAKTLCTEIGRDLEDPNVIPQEQTLEKFTTLIAFLRTMNTQQLRELLKELDYIRDDPDDVDKELRVKINAWKAFRDAIASAGTGPGLILVTEMIKDNKLDAFEIMGLLSTLAKSAKEPTPEYINTFFKMATELEARREDNVKGASTQEAWKDDAISTSAILAFTELLRYAQINQRTAHNRYPVHVFGSFIPKENDALLRDYIPYLVDKLEQGIQENTARATVYIRALGNVAHPKTIAIFEPYLEGEKPSTVYHRQMMVIALDKLISLQPQTIQGLSYRIYQNTGESYKVRVLAVYVFMKTKPPLALLQRVAQFTNYDVSKHVNSIVKSFIENIAELKGGEYKDFARDARIASVFLTSENYGEEYSTGQIVEYFLREVNIHWTAETAWIYGEDSILPQGLYKNFNARYGDFKEPKDETGIMVSSVKGFYKTLKYLLKNVSEKKEDKFQSKKAMSASDTIVDMLDIEERKKDKFEFFYLSRDEYSSSYFVIGEDLLSPIPKEYIKRAIESVKSGKNFDLLRFYNFEFTVGFPTATGLPFTFDFQVPLLHRLSGKLQSTISPDFSQESTAALQSVNAVSDIRVVLSQKEQSRFGFVTPFEGKRYLTGIDKNIQFYIPLNAKANYDAFKKQVQLKITPINKKKESKLFHYSTVPFTSRYDLKDFKPPSSEDHLGKLIMKEGVQESTTFIGKETRGTPLKITESKLEGSANVWKKIMDPSRALENLLFPTASREIEYYRIDVHDVPSSLSEQSIDLVISWDSASKNKPTDSKLFKSSHRWSSKPEIIEPSDKKLSSLSRKKDMLQETMKDLAVAEAVTIDIALELRGQDPKSYLLTTAVATSKIDGKFKALVYIRSDDAATPNKPFEACATAQGSSPYLPPFEIDKIDNEELKRTLDISFSAGSSCKSGIKSDLHAYQWQSPEFTKLLHKNEKLYEALGVPKTFLNKITLVLQTAANDVDDQWRNHPKNINSLEPYKNEAINTNGDKEYNSEDKAYVNLGVDFEPADKTARLELTAPIFDLDYTDKAKLPWSIIPLLSAQSEETYKGRGLKEFGKRELHHRITSPEGVCVLEKDYVNTFDGAEYPLKMNNCWYVAVTSVREKESKFSKPEIPLDKQVAITIRKDELDESKRDLSLSLGDDEIQLSKPSAEIEIKLNRKPIDLSSGAYFDKEGEENELEIIQLSDDAVRIKSTKFGLKVTFDGYRAQIKVADKYRDSVRGLCGNFDTEPSNDLLTPSNRLSSNPQDFISFYVLPVKECQSTSKNLREAEKSLPLYKPRLNNVVSDREAGRTTHQGKWGLSDSLNEKDTRKHNTIVRTKIFPTDGKTCFSLRPLPTCAPGTLPARVKSVLFPVYCLPNGKSAERLSDRIHRGANPDLSQKSPSMKVKFEIAERCSPAA